MASIDMSGLNPSGSTGRVDFTPTDYTQNLARQYSLAEAGMGYEQQAQQFNDKKIVQDYLRQGGDLTTPEGIQKATSDLKGKVSPDNYMKLVQMHNTSEDRALKLVGEYAKLPEDQLKGISAQQDIIANGLMGPLEVYKKAASEKGEQAALEDYNASKQATIQMLSQMKRPDGQPIIPPELLQRFSKMNPAETESALNATRYVQGLHKTALDQRKEEAQAAYYEAGAKERSQGKELTSLQAIDTALANGEITAEEAKKLKEKVTTGGKTSGISVLSDDAAKYMAADYRRLGSQVLARLGPTDRSRVIELAAQQAKSEGKTEEADSLNRMAIKANQQALNRLTTQQNMIGAFERTADKQLGLVVELGRKIPRTDWPIINKALIEGRKTIEGNPDASNFLSTIITTQADLARVLSGATSAAGTSDASRREAAEMLSKSLSQDQIESLAKNIRKELKFKMEGFEEQKKELMGASKIEKESKPKKEAPARMLQYLKDHPDERTKRDFKEFYGYLPEGM